MGMFDFKRYDGFTGSIPQKFADANIPNCPLCGSGDPHWTLKQKMELTATRVMFKCSKCDGILSATQDDFTGATKSTARAFVSTAGLINALSKKHDGKDLKTVYVKIEDLGKSAAPADLLGKDLPIDQIQAMGVAKNTLKKSEE